MADYMEIARRALERRQPASHEADSLEAVLKGEAIELWSDLLGERLWLVSDEPDAARLGEPRGSVYTAAEARSICRVTDPKIVQEIHGYKRKCGGTVSDYRMEGK